MSKRLSDVEALHGQVRQTKEQAAELVQTVVRLKEVLGTAEARAALIQQRADDADERVRAAGELLMQLRETMERSTTEARVVLVNVERALDHFVAAGEAVKEQAEQQRAAIEGGLALLEQTLADLDETVRARAETVLQEMLQALKREQQAFEDDQIRRSQLLVQNVQVLDQWVRGATERLTQRLDSSWEQTVQQGKGLEQVKAGLVQMGRQLEEKAGTHAVEERVCAVEAKWQAQQEQIRAQAAIIQDKAARTATRVEVLEQAFATSTKRVMLGMMIGGLLLLSLSVAALLR